LVDRLDPTAVHEHWGRVERLSSAGTVVCAVQNGWLNVFDASGSRITRLASRRAVKPDGASTGVGGMVLDGHRVCVTGDGVLEVLDLTDPRNPVSLARTATTWGAGEDRRERRVGVHGEHGGAPVRGLHRAVDRAADVPPGILLVRRAPGRGRARLRAVNEHADGDVPGRG
jgi:hypothetical protein